MLGTSEYFRLLSTGRSLRFNETSSVDVREASDKLRSFSEE
ncbi:hypothetical protein [Thermoplasma sp. Kam2015]|nr:hypothetical protein [Thermoplasma sp. Kam2015]